MLLGSNQHAKIVRLEQGTTCIGGISAKEAHEAHPCSAAPKSKAHEIRKNLPRERVSHLHSLVPLEALCPQPASSLSFI